MQTEIEPLLSVHDASELLCVSPRTIRRWSLSGVLPSLLLGGTTVRFRRSELAQWLETQTREVQR